MHPGDNPELTIASEQDGNPAVWGASTKTMRLWLCQKCARRRRSTQRLFYLAFALALALAIASGLIIKAVR